jgi:hypothetical protein
MMIYRSVVVGLLAAIAMLLAEQGAIRERTAAPPPAGRVVAPPPTWADPRGVGELGPTTIVHISGRAGHDPRAALGIGARERVLAIDDVPVADDGDVALLARWRHGGPGSYFELLVRGDTVRRLLVLRTR